MRPASLLLPVALLAACGGDDGAGVDTPDASSTTDGAQPDGGHRDPLAGVGAATLVQGGFQFVEGPQWIDDGTLRFTDIPASTIYQLTPPSTVEVFRTPSDNAIGLALLADGRMLAAEHGARRVSVTSASGTVTALVAQYDGQPFNSPNDVVAREDGVVYFTDPPYGLPNGTDSALGFMGIFRVPASGPPAVAEEQGALTARPNGIALSPNSALLYVDDTDAGTLRAFDVGYEGELTNPRVVSTEVPGADGMAVDIDGNIYVAASTGVVVVSPTGHVYGTIQVAEQPSNCAFGGADARTLYITARTGLYRVEVPIAGLPRN